MPGPAPDAAAASVPTVHVEGGGGAGGGGGGKKGKKGKGKKGAGKNKGKEKVKGGRKSAKKEGKCATDPVDVVTGRVFTFPITEFATGGPIPLVFERTYSSAARDRNIGLGYGWTHTLGWEIETTRRQLTVWDEEGTGIVFAKPDAGQEVIGAWGWLVRHEPWGYSVDADDGYKRSFSQADSGGTRFRLTAVEDRRHNKISLTYDGGRLTEIVDSAGRRLKVDSSTEGLIQKISLVGPVESGLVWTLVEYRYDSSRNLVVATDAEGWVHRYEYDADHLMTVEVDRTGLAFHFIYDQAQRCIEAWGNYSDRLDPSLARGLPTHLADGRTKVKGIGHCRFHYEDDGYSEVVDSSQVRRYFGNELGLLEKSFEGGSSFTCTYDELGNLASWTDAFDATVTYERDERGRLLKSTNPLGHSDIVERDEQGRATRVFDGEGGEWKFERDRFGDVTLATDAAGGATSFSRDDRGLVTEAVTPDGARRLFEYDAHGNALAMTLPNGGRWQFTYDYFGRRTSMTDPMGATTRMTFSPRGDLIARQDPLGGVSHYAYDGEHHLVSCSEDGATTKFVWGGYHVVCGWTDANGATTTLGYDLDGQLLEITNPRGAVHRFVYDPSGRLVEERTFDGRRLRYDYDAMGRCVRRENGAGERVEMKFDAAAHLVEKEFSDGEKHVFEYNGRSELIAATTSVGRFTFERDPLGQVIRETQTVFGDTHHVETTWDLTNRRIAHRPSRGPVVEIQRDAMGRRRRTSVGTQVLEHVHDLNGEETVRALPSGGVIETSWDPLRRLTRRVARHPTMHRPQVVGQPDWIGPLPIDASAILAFSYDPRGEIEAKFDQASGNTRFEYDGIGQLLAATNDDGRRERFDYDAAGNITDAGLSRDYDIGNRLLRKGATEYEYDGNGRLIEKRSADTDAAGTWRYEWTAQGFLAAVDRPDGARLTFAYDPFGRRMLKTIVPRDGTVSVTRFIWEGDVVVHEARSQGGAETFSRAFFYTDEPFVPLGHVSERVDEPAADWCFYLNDPVGAPDKLLDGAGNVRRHLDRKVWGATADETDATTPLRFPGQYADPETGLHYNRFRYYDPTDARFISPDPIGLQGDANLFAYVPNPLSWLDYIGWDWNYRLTDSNGVPYYNGRASDNESAGDIMSRHRNNPKPPKGPRMAATDKLEQVTPHGTDRETVRGVEDVGSQETLSKGKCKASRKKNRIRGISDRKKDSDNDREGANYGAARKKGPACVSAQSGGGSTVAGMPALTTHSPGGPTVPLATSWPP